MANPLTYRGTTAGEAGSGLLLSRMTPVMVTIPGPPTPAFYQFMAAGSIAGATETCNAASFSWESGTGISDLPGRINDQIGSVGQATAFGICDQYGPTAVIGAAAENPGSPPTVGTQGTVYIYTESATAVWTQAAALQGSDTANGDYLGSSVSIYNGVVAAANNPGGGGGPVGVYIWTGAGGSWTQTQKLTFNVYVAGVKLFGNYLFVATMDAANTGAILVHLQTSPGVYTLIQTIATGLVGDFFGWASATAMDFDGRTLAVGALGAGVGGEVFLYQIVAGQFVLFQKIAGGSDTVAGDQFGSSVSISQNLLAVGANRADTNGAAYVFLLTGTAFAQVQKVVSPNAAGSLDNSFGIAVLVAIFASVTFLIVGAPFYDSTGSASGGAVYFYSAVAGFGGDPEITFVFKGAKIYGAGQ